MRRISVVDDDRHGRLAMRASLLRCGFRVVIADGGARDPAALDPLGATRCLRQPFKPPTLPLSVIDECLAEAAPRRRYAATLAAVTTSLCDRRGGTTPSSIWTERVFQG